jgi:PAS domain S-box-containing protein
VLAETRAPRLWSASLAVRLLAIAVLAVIPAAALLVGIAFEQRSGVIRKAERDVLRVAQASARDQERVIDTASQLLTVFTHSAEVLARDGARCSALAAGTLATLSDYGNIAATTADGDMFCSAVPLPGRVNAGDRPYFMRALRTGAVAAGVVANGRIRQNPSVVIAAPATNGNGKVVAVGLIGIDLTRFEQRFARTALPPAARVVLFDRTGQILARLPSQSVPPPPAWPVADAARARIDANLIAPGPDGVEYLWGVAPIRESTGLAMSIAVGFPRSGALAAANHILVTQLAALALAIALSLVVVWLAGYAFLRRQVQALIAAARRLGSGERGARTNLPYQGELGQLARALDDTAEALEQRQALLGTAEVGRYRAEHELEEKDEVLWLVLEGVRDHAVVLLDEGGHVASWHTGAKRVTGYESRDILGRTLATFFSGDQRENIVDELLRKASQHVSVNYEGALLKADGTPFVANVTITALWEETRLRGFTVVIRDITEGQRAEESLRAHGERLQQLSKQLMEIQETERRVLACELHDEVGQALTAMKINLQALRRPYAVNALAERIDDTIGIVDGLLRRVREMSLDLRPSLLDDWGLAAAIHWYAKRQAERSDMTVTFATALGDDRFAADVETACYRVVQEAITNAIRHARARRIGVELERQGQRLSVAVTDDGTGFDVAAARCAASHGRSMGILGMEERVRLLGGVFTIESTPDRGTEIRASLPFAASTESPATVRAS